MPTPNAGKPYPQMLADLKGLKIGISTPGASTDVTLRFLLREAGLDPQKDVTIVPVGDPTTALAGLKNGLIDGNMSVEPTQTAAVTGLKIAKHVLNIENGEGPELFRDFAYNGVFARGSTLKERPQAARAVVAAIVEAEQRIQDPNHLDDDREGGASLHARHRCRPLAHLSADLPRELQLRWPPRPRSATSVRCCWPAS